MLIDITKPLQRGRSISPISVKKKKIWVAVKYKKLPKFCLCCGKMTHGERGCCVSTPKSVYKAEAEKRYGVWMRAQSFGRVAGGGADRKGYDTGA